MKKITLAFIATLLFVTCLWGCGKNEEKLSDAAKGAMEAVKNWDLDEVKKYVADMGVMEEEEKPEATGEQDKEEDVYGDTFLDYLKDMNGKMTYQIVKADEKTGKVEIKCKYIDSTEFIEEFFKQSLTYAFSNAFSDDEKSPEDESEELRKIVKMARTAVEKETYIEKVIDLTFIKKDGTYKIKKIDEEFANVMTANCYGALKSVSDSLDEEENASAKDKEKEKEAAKAVKYEGTILENGVLLEVTNEYSQSINEVRMEVNFLGENGNILDSTTVLSTMLEQGEKRTVFVAYYGENVITDYQVTVDCVIVSGQDNYENHLKEVSYHDNVGDDGIMVNVTNNALAELSRIDVISVYYKDGKPFSATQDSTYDLKSKSNTTLELGLPYNKETYETEKYDDYKIYISEAFSEKN